MPCRILPSNRTCTPYCVTRTIGPRRSYVNCRWWFEVIRRCLGHRYIDKRVDRGPISEYRHVAPIIQTRFVSPSLLGLLLRQRSRGSKWSFRFRSNRNTKEILTLTNFAYGQIWTHASSRLTGCWPSKHSRHTLCCPPCVKQICRHTPLLPSKQGSVVVTVAGEMYSPRGIFPTTTHHPCRHDSPVHRPGELRQPL